MPIDDDENFVAYGTALDPIEEEEVVRKKPITIQEQIATDENGRRRFHGAFTGGFSAGYYNTVGSKEGWTPSTFKSSRSDRFATKGQNVTDYMDDEDMGAFGIAPQVLRPTDEFATSSEQGKASESSRKRPKPVVSDGPIPGIPVLHQIIEPVKETIGIKILIKMGWRPGQGVGPRVVRKKLEKSKRKGKSKLDEIEKPTIVEEMEVDDEIQRKKSYGCELPPELARTIRGAEDEDSDSDSDGLDVNVLYAPEDVDSPLCNPKENSFGLGYKGLERLTDSVGHIDLFGKPLNFRVEKKNMNITGEAFGIGAFEEPDEDVYNREDMSQYDFELETMEERKKRKIKEALEKGKRNQRDKRCIEGFRLAKNPELQREFFPPPRLPHDFKPVHVSRKSRFDQPAVSETDSGASKRGLGRHALTIQERQVLLGEQSNAPKSVTSETVTATEETVPPVTAVGGSSDQTTSAAIEKSPSILERVERIKKFVQVLQAHSAKAETNVSQDKPGFKPFMKNPEKQDRYDKFLTLVSSGFQDCLKDIQPLEMTEWEKEREKQEFERAAAIYKPLSGVMQSRFVSAKSHDISHLAPEREAVAEKDPTDDPKVAAKMNLFGKLTHSVVEWHPDKLLCKRFNIKDPYPDSKFVGLRGGTSTARKESAAVISNQTLQAEASSSASQTKKSLFENLDFSKPPPGLLSANRAGESDGNTEPPPPGTLEESQGNPSNSGETKSLEFQKNIGRHEEKETLAPPKPPMDLFKEIFADSSSESEDEEPSQKDLNKKPEESEQREKTHSAGKGKVISDLRLSERDDRGRDKEKSRSGEKSRRRFDSEDRPEERRDKESAKKDDRKRGIFDKLDLNQFRDKKTSPPSKTATGTEKTESEGEDEEYGPRVPIKVLAANSQHSSTSKSSLTFPNVRGASSDVAVKPTLPSSTLQVLTGKKSEEEEVVWVEKDVVQENSSKSSKSRKHSIKKSKKSKKAKSKSSRHKGKHKKSKKHKSKSKVSRSRNGGHSDDSSALSSSDEDDVKTKKPAAGKDDDDSSDNSSSSVKIHGSLDQKALLQQLKQITKSH